MSIPALHLNRRRNSTPRAGEFPPEQGKLIRELIESIDDIFWIANADVSEVYYVTPAYEKLWGKTCQSLFEDSMSWLESVHPDDRELAASVIEQAPREGGCCLEYRLLRPNGAIRWIRNRAFCNRDKIGNVTHLIGVAEDITERKRVDQELRRSEEFNRLLSDLTSDYAYTSRIEPDGTAIVEEFSDGFERVTGYTLEELNKLGGWPALIHPDDLQKTIDLNATLQENDRLVAELRIVTKDKRVLWMRYSSQMLRSVPGGRVDRVVGASQDVTERRNAEDKMRELSRRLLEVQEHERRHLACELHDQVAQLLTALSLNLEAVAHSNPNEAKRALEQSQAVVKELAAQVRDLSLQLRPTMLDDFGLVPAFLWLFDCYASRRQLHVQFEHAGLSQQRFSQEMETAAYRIVQEALTNVVRHAGVDEVTVRIWIADRKLLLTVEDCGRGFDFHDMSSRCSSAGLSGMKERASLLGGTLTVESTPDRGTLISASIPIQGPKSKDIY